MFCLLLFISPICVFGDVYLHNPRGSNNRLNEGTAQRNNENRLFDSQNNNRGGYNVGDKERSSSGGNVNKQYNMKYFQSSKDHKSLPDGKGGSYLTIEWTNQHGCGPNTDADPNKLNCNMVIQYMCEKDTGLPTGQFKSDNTIRNGVSTNTQDYERPGELEETYNDFKSRFSDQVRLNKGLHESMQWYEKCYIRQRNMNLFTADQNLQNKLRISGMKYSSAAQTRQNPKLGDNDRYGYECPEERDYYPYWHPSPWKDIVVTTSNASLCRFYQDKSFNVKPYHECVEEFTTDGNGPLNKAKCNRNGGIWQVEKSGVNNGGKCVNRKRHFSRWNNEADCVESGGLWQQFHNYLDKSRAFEHLGCYRDTNSRIMDYPTFVQRNTLEFCELRCRAASYDFFGVQNGQDCWCSNDEQRFDTHGPSDNCNVGCKGDPKQICGGFWAMNIYRVNSEENCLSQNREGVKHMWEVPHSSSDLLLKECLVKLDPPNCEEAEWSRTNHLGNGREGVPSNYTWTIPYFPSQRGQRCVLRLRYNVSSDDFNPWRTDVHDNDVTVHDDPEVDIGLDHTVELNIQTDQYGRTFQDRSHVFILEPRPDGLQNERIYNLNVRGKRGNIVQVFPAVEYDFIPNHLTINSDEDLIHIQWTGSNSHGNNPPAGDGQAGDDGQGQGGTDRSNFVQTDNANVNYPLPFEQTIFTNNGAIEVVWSYHGRSTSDGLSLEDIALGLATSGFYECCKPDDCNGKGPEDNEDIKLDANLNKAPASYPGILIKVKQTGVFHYMCSRNNNFSNRSQKGKITVL